MGCGRKTTRPRLLHEGLRVVHDSDGIILVLAPWLGMEEGGSVRSGDFFRVLDELLIREGG